jgi:beta-galactosidase GanA
VTQEKNKVTLAGMDTLNIGKYPMIYSTLIEPQRYPNDTASSKLRAMVAIVTDLVKPLIALAAVLKSLLALESSDS